MQSTNSRWLRIGGCGINGSWDAVVYEQTAVRTLAVYQNRAYAGLVSDISGEGEVWEYDGAAWTQVGGDGIAGSWSGGTKRGVYSLAADGTYLYAGLGDQPGDAEVWRFDGASWTQIGGDGLASSWPDAAHDEVWSMTFHQGQLYVGLTTERAGPTKALLYRYDGSLWSLVTGESGELGGWSASDGYTMTYLLTSDGTNLYVGLAGRTSGAADVWRFNGTSFTQIGGDGLNGSWSDPEIHYVEDLYLYNGKLYAGVQRPSSIPLTESSVWEYNGTSWRAVGTAIPTEWADLHIFNKLLAFGGRLYVTAGGVNYGASMWELQNDETWSKVGGDHINGSHWVGPISPDDAPTHALWIYPMIEFQGDMLVGLASSGVRGWSQIWRYR